MKTYGLLLLVWLGLATANATNRPPVDWNQGALVLTNGTLLEGEISYNWRAEIVQYRQNNTIKAFSTFQISTFSYFDSRANQLRKFVAIAFPVKSSLMRPVFLEEITTGPLMVYRRFRHVHEPIRALNPLVADVNEAVISDLESFDYYVIDGDGLSGLDEYARTRWTERKIEYPDALHRYLTKLAINPNSTLARLLLINHYNYLKQQPILTTPAKPALTGLGLE